MPDDRPALRIGEVSRRTGVGVPTLRAWERRYGLLEPERTDGGHRLYSEADVERVRSMQRLLDDGWSASVAAGEVTREPATVTRLRAIEGTGDAAQELASQLEAAIGAFDAAAAETVVDDVFARFQVPRAMDEVLLPVLSRLGDGWQDDPQVIAREHFASNLLRPRLHRLLRRPTRAGARTCVAAAPEGEEHDLGLLCSAAVLVDAGWRVHYLGARTPVSALVDASARLGADAMLIGALHRQHATSFLDELAPLGSIAVVLGGAGFEPDDADRVAGILHQGPISTVPDSLDRALRRRRAAT